MKRKLEDFWYDYEGLALTAIAVSIFVAIVAGVIGIPIWQNGNVYKFNCNLDSRPNWYTVVMVDSSTYAYDPDYFCSHLREIEGESE